MAKFVRESLSEGTKSWEVGTAKKTKKSNSFGKKQAITLVKKYLPYLNITFDDLGDRTDGNVGYSADEQYELWDQLSVETGNEQVDEIGTSLYLVKPLDSDEISVKFYLDSVAFIPEGSDDEYNNFLDPVSLKEFTKKDWEMVFDQLKEYVGYDEKEWEETKKGRAEWEKEMKDPNSKWIKEHNFKQKEGVYKGHWEYNWDEKLKKWLNIQDRYLEMKKRGYDYDQELRKFVPEDEVGEAMWNEIHPGDPGFKRNPYR
jgi:hypothetical protein